MSLLHNTQQLTHACINPWFLKTTLVVWNWWINLINFTLKPSTSALNGIIFVMLSKMAVLWFRRLTLPFNWLILSQNFCHTHGLSNYDDYSWVGDTFLIMHASFSLFTTYFLFPHCSFFSFALVTLYSFMVTVHEGALTLVLLQWFKSELCTVTFTHRVLIHMQSLKPTLQKWGSVMLNWC